MKKLLSALLIVLMWAGSSVAASVSVVDQAGRTVLVPQPVKRVVTTFMPATLFALCSGLSDSLVGASNKDTKIPIYKAVMQDKPQPVHVGNRSMGINMEAVMASKPDLVIMYGQRDGRRLANLLASMGIPALIIKPESLDDMRDTLQLIAKAAGREEQAAKTLGAMERIEVLVKERLSSVKGKKRPEVYYAANSLMRTASGEMLQSKIIALAGGKSVSRNVKGFFSSVTQEQLLFWNPEYVIASGKVSSKDIGRLKTSPLNRIVAAQKGNVFKLPPEAYWDYPSPLSYAGVLWMAAIFHPEVFADIDVEQEVALFYDAIFGDGFSQKNAGVAGLR